MRTDIHISFELTSIGLVLVDAEVAGRTGRFIVDTGCSLTALDTVNLMLSIETEFGIKIPDRDMTPSNFRSIAQIDQLISRLTGKQENAPA